MAVGAEDREVVQAGLGRAICLGERNEMMNLEARRARLPEARTRLQPAGLTRQPALLLSGDAELREAQLAAALARVVDDETAVFQGGALARMPQNARRIRCDLNFLKVENADSIRPAERPVQLGGSSE